MDLLDTDTALRAFVNQQVHEFDTLVMDDAEISVKMKNPKNMMKKLSSFDEFSSSDEKSHKYCIAIQIKTGKSKVTSYGFADDIYDAIMFAKKQMLNTLHENINNAISNAQQLNDVEQIRQGLGIKH